MNNNIFLVFFAALLVPAINSVSHAAEQRKSATTAQIDGQLFIVTKGQQAIKLALVNVAVVSEDGMVNFLRTKANAANAIRRDLVPTIRELKEEQMEIRKELQPALRKVLELRKEIFRDGDTPCKGLYGMAYVDCLNSPANTEKKRNTDALELSLGPLREKDRNVSLAYKEIIERYDRAVRPSVFLAGLESFVTPVATTKTDADGKFNVAVPMGKRVALIARASRLAGGETEEYLWLLWVPVKKGEAKIAVTLANDNLFETGCGDCITYVPLLETHSLN